MYFLPFLDTEMGMYRWKEKETIFSNDADAMATQGAEASAAMALN